MLSKHLRSLNQLSTEMLWGIFDYLNHEEQLEAMLTCYRWFEILSCDRYRKHRRMHLSSQTLCKHENNAEFYNFPEMKLFRAFAMEFSLDVEYMNNLREFLFCDEVATNLEELCLQQSPFFDSNSYLYLPVLNEKWDAMQGSEHAEFPKLRKVVIENPNWMINPIMQRYSEQVTDLTLHYLDRDMFLLALGCRPFRNVQRLTLVAEECSQNPRLTSSDFCRPHLLLFRRLKYLKIIDRTGVFFYAYKVIIHAATNIDTLIIHGTNMSEKAFNKIDGLKQLKELYLHCRVFQSRQVEHLSLPKLEKLTTCQQIAPLASAPSLRALHIKDHTRIWGRFVFGEEEKLSGYFSRFDRHLEELSLEKIDLDATIIKLICGLTKLRRLVMDEVDIEQAAFYRILRSLHNLQMTRFVKCSFVIPVNSVQEAEPGDADRKNTIAFFEKLRDDFPKCSVVNVKSSVVRRCLGSKHLSK